ncbi:MAG: hypothetical protein K2N05_12350 [Muribaculaceae bacterium]|nr:hypothetical protein [Muribaculaceae bacterium]
MIERQLINPQSELGKVSRPEALSHEVGKPDKNESLGSKDLDNSKSQPWWKEEGESSQKLDGESEHPIKDYDEPLSDLVNEDSERIDAPLDSAVENGSESNNLDQTSAANETGEQESVADEIGKAGGRYQDLKNEGYGWNTKPPTEVHHMPADSSSNLERCDGPAIVMDYEDHRETASCGNSREAQEYRAKQKELIEQGKFREAFQMDVDDLREKFGNKYDDAIANAEKYLDKLEAENKI